MVTNVEGQLPRCLCAVAACEKAVHASRDIVGYSDLTLLVPHAVSLILTEQKTSHLSAARWLRYHTCLLDMPNITVKRCSTFNPATLLPLPDDGEEHNCGAELQVQCSPRPDLSDEPLSNSDLILYVDGSASRDPVSGTNCVGFSVCSDNEVLLSSSLPHHLSAQAAELIAQCWEDTGLAWTKVLPLILMYIRMRKRTRSNLSPYEIIFATPPHIGVDPPSSPLPSTDLCDHDMLSYCSNLTSSLSDIRKQVARAQQVLLTTHTAVKKQCKLL